MGRRSLPNPMGYAGSSVGASAELTRSASPSTATPGRPHAPKGSARSNVPRPGFQRLSGEPQQLTLNDRATTWANCAAICRPNGQQIVVAESGPLPSAGVASWRSEAAVPTLDSATRFGVGVSHSSEHVLGGARELTRLCC